jgi:hypothetical protein
MVVRPRRDQPGGGRTGSPIIEGILGISSRGGGTTSLNDGPPRGGGSTSTRRPLGVPEDYTATGRRDLSGMSARAAEGWAAQGAGHGTAVQRRPRYFEGDEWRPAADLSPNSQAEMQRRLVAGGWLSGSGWTLGVWGPKTASAYADLLSFANARGIDAEAAMILSENGALADTDEFGNIVEPGGGSGTAGPTPIPGLVVRTTDPKVLADIFRKAVIEIAGTGWSRERINTAVMAFNEVERQRQEAQYEAELASQLTVTDRTEVDPTTGEPIPVGQSGEVVDIPSPESYISAYVREQDPDAVEDFEALSFTGEAMKLLGSPAWGVGGGMEGLS